LPVGAHVLELGSGPGIEAKALEERGFTVRRTDGARAFVAMLRADGYAADLLDVRVDPLGGPYDAVYADAVLLHLTREEFADVLVRARKAVVHGGVLAMTLKEGDGEELTTERLGLPRRYTYWREAQLREAMARTGWTPLSVQIEPGERNVWLNVIARAADEAPIGSAA
jgi:predicted TPR repeat methyltransferase